MSSIGESLQQLRSKLQSLGKRGGGGAASGGSASKVDAKAMLAWAKANPVIVASVAVMVVVPAASWWFASDIHAAADEAASKRAQEFAALDKLEKSSVEIALPGRAAEQRTGVISARTVRAYQELAERFRGDALELQSMALERNRRSRDALVADVTVTRANNNTVAEAVHGKVIERADATLQRLRAGGPPDEQSVVDQLQRTQDQFVAREQKPDRKSLTADEAERLSKQLLERRLQLYADAARNVSFYAERDDLGLPLSSAEAGKQPTEAVLFGWQWRLWIVEDFLEAVAAANASAKSVLDAPVKRILSIQVREDVVPAAAKPAAAEGEGGEASAAAPAGPPPIDPKAPVTYDFSRSFTGRTSNHVYDVRQLSVRMVVSTSRLPEVMDAIARTNFMTVLSMEVRPADAFAAAAEGLVYGPDAVSEVRMTIESLWMRQWLARLMPRELQVAKGSDGRTVDDPAPAEEAPAAEAPNS
jgi:hypothetical protein